RRAARALLEEALGDPVLERMKGEDGKTAAGMQQTLGGAETGRELAELAIHIDAKRLKGAGGRADALAGAAADRLLDDLGQRSGAGDRRLGPGAGDGAHHGMGAPFLAEHP